MDQPSSELSTHDNLFQQADTCDGSTTPEYTYEEEPEINHSDLMKQISPKVSFDKESLQLRPTTCYPSDPLTVEEDQTYIDRKYSTPTQPTSKGQIPKTLEEQLTEFLGSQEQQRSLKSSDSNDTIIRQKWNQKLKTVIFEEIRHDKNSEKLSLLYFYTSSYTRVDQVTINELLQFKTIAKWYEETPPMVKSAWKYFRRTAFNSLRQSGKNLLLQLATNHK